MTDWQRGEAHSTQMLRTDYTKSLLAIIKPSLTSPKFRELGPDAHGLRQNKGLWQALALSLTDRNHIQIARVLRFPDEANWRLHLYVEGRDIIGERSLGNLSAVRSHIRTSRLLEAPHLVIARGKTT